MSLQTHLQWVKKNHPDYPAKIRLEVARNRARIDELEYETGYFGPGYQITMEHDGHDVVIRTRDDDTGPRGTFSNESGDIVNPNWSYGSRDTYKYWTNETGETVENLIAWFNSKGGMSKSVARDAVIGMLRKECIADGENAYYGVTVYVSKAGVRLGEASIWGNGGDLYDEYEILDVVLNQVDVLDEAIDNAQAQIARLRAAFCEEAVVTQYRKVHDLRRAPCGT